ncbi:helix-turn-helix domain-containing protein [Streptomyces hebeiensis]|uniref:Helix-turn-helix domain-containing protein n=1 Tax=Streptomyces hebeiensis TaxID=229486 RepID=A0ABP4FLV9_9ACTN
MAVQQLNAPTRSQSGVPAPGSPVPATGVTHVRHRHVERFTVVGNHLTQHRELSLTAIGLGVHIQSLPDGAKIGIKALAERFAEGEIRIAAALRELERHGYLDRTRVRTASAHWVTRTVAYDAPPGLVPERKGRPPARPSGTPAPPPSLRPAQTAERPVPLAAPEQTPSPRPAPLPPPLPEPDRPEPARHRAATELLAGLRRHDARLLLSARDVARLAPAVSAWLERDVEPEAVRRTLTSLLPQDPIRRPAALLAHRLTELLPPPLPAAPAAPRVHPLRNCDSCDRAFRSEGPEDCPGCRKTRTP